MTTNLILLALLFLPAGLLAEISDDYHNYLDGSTTCGKAPFNRRQISISPIGRSAAPYVFNGNNSHYGEWPFLAWVRLNATWCSGVIYSSKVVFTAGHCIRRLFKDWDAGIKTEITDPEMQVYVVVGKVSFQSTDKSEVRHDIEAVQMGAYFEARRIFQDGPNFARLWVREPIKFSNFVQPVCVLKDVGEIDKVAHGKVFFIGNGYNYEAYGRKTHPNKSQWLEMETCDPEYWKGRRESLSVSHFCPTDKIMRGVCHGDSGGPLVGLDKNKRWSLVAIGMGSAGSCHNYGVPHEAFDAFMMMERIVGMFDKNFKVEPGVSAIVDGRRIYDYDEYE